MPGQAVKTMPAGPEQWQSLCRNPGHVCHPFPPLRCYYRCHLLLAGTCCQRMKQGQATSVPITESHILISMEQGASVVTMTA